MLDVGLCLDLHITHADPNTGSKHLQVWLNSSLRSGSALEMWILIQQREKDTFSLIIQEAWKSVLNRKFLPFFFAGHLLRYFSIVHIFVPVCKSENNRYRIIFDVLVL